MKVLILMAGPSEDFEQKGHAYPKYLLELQNKPIVQRIIESLENLGSEITCIVRHSDQEKYFLGDMLRILCPKIHVIEIAGSTQGAICTALFAIDQINSDEELLVLNGDQLIKADLLPHIENFRKRHLDGGLLVMHAIHPKFSSVLLDDNGLVAQTSEKRPISALASTGCCYYRKGKDFVQAAFSVIEKDASTNGAYYISATYNEMILMQKKIGVSEINKKDYVSFASYQMYENYVSHRREKND